MSVRRALRARVAILACAASLAAGSAFAGPSMAVAATADTSGPGAAARAPGAALPSVAELERLARESRERWQASPHGEMLARILPERLTPSRLPQPESTGARLVALYCVQCHHLPNPAMHDARRWRKTVERMVPRMQGEGNMGRLMSEMMLGPGGASARPLAAPSRSESVEIVAYLQRHAMRTADRTLAAALDTPDGAVFERACSQCHALPDPRSHSATEWPQVVRRMASNMEWMNRIVGSLPDVREPQLRSADIVRFLQRHARPQRGP